MRNKSPLILIEQVLMVLIFALAAAFCLRAFVLSEQLSLQTQQRGDAALLAQNAVEVLKSCGGDYEEAAVRLGGAWDGDCWQLEEEDLVLTVIPETCGTELLGRARVQVCSRAGDVLFTLPAAWQEVSGNA